MHPTRLEIEKAAGLASVMHECTIDLTANTLPLKLKEKPGTKKHALGVAVLNSNDKGIHFLKSTPNKHCQCPCTCSDGFIKFVHRL